MLDEGVQERREAVRRRGVVETATRMDGRRKRGDRPESARRALHARDAATGRPLGVGYVELTGYAGAVSL